MRQADNIDNPKRIKLIELLNDILNDSILSSQVEQRIGRTLGADFVLKSEGKNIDESSTELLRDAVWFPRLITYIIESKLFGHSLIEFDSSQEGELSVCLLPRQNVIPTHGKLLFDVADDKGASYREMREFGTWILEFGDPESYGLLNKAVPHILFKRFAQSCWSELCEIYGIPPRFIKTDTQDPAMLDRAEAMLRDMGSAAYFIIDSTEEFQFAKGADTNGDVYNNLIQLCNSEVSLLISGAQIGQDTRNGNRSKEETSVKQLDELVRSDKRYVEDYLNSSVLPALTAIGVLPDGLRFSYLAENNLDKLWSMATQAMPHFEVDPIWITETFGIQVTGLKKQESANLQLRQPDFFA